MYKKLVIGAAVLGFAAIISPYRFWEHQTPIPQISGAIIEAVTQNPKPKEIEPDTPKLVSSEVFGDLQAKAALALDLNTNTVLYSNNSDEQLPIASLTKLMTAMVVLDHVNKDKVVTIEKSDVSVIGSKMGLAAGETITVENLLKGLLIPSGNDAAEALARFVGTDEADFVTMMNDKVRALGLQNTSYANPVGLDEEGNYSTAEDLSKITKEFMKYSFLANIVNKKSLDVSSVDGKIIHHLKTTNKLLVDNPEVFGVKTGSTTEAQGNLIVEINHNNAKVLTIVLNTPNREDDSQKLIDWIFKSYSWNSKQ